MPGAESPRRAPCPGRPGPEPHPAARARGHRDGAHGRLGPQVSRWTMSFIGSFPLLNRTLSKRPFLLFRAAR